MWLLLLVTTAPLVAFAAPPAPPAPAAAVKIPNSLTVVLDSPTAVLGKIGTITNWVFAILLTLAVLFVILAAFNYLTGSSGEGVETAHMMLKYAAIAIAVAVLAQGFVKIIAKIAGQKEKVEFVKPV